MFREGRLCKGKFMNVLTLEVTLHTEGGKGRKSSGTSNEYF